MKCLRCGYCCSYPVIIVVNPKYGPNKKDNLRLKKQDERCPYLTGNKPGKYNCSIHKKSWYKQTPCYNHTQIEATNNQCRLGEYILKKGK